MGLAADLARRLRGEQRLRERWLQQKHYKEFYLYHLEVQGTGCAATGPPEISRHLVQCHCEPTAMVPLAGLANFGAKFEHKLRCMSWMVVAVFRYRFLRWDAMEGGCEGWHDEFSKAHKQWVQLPHSLLWSSVASPRSPMTRSRATRSSTR